MGFIMTSLHMHVMDFDHIRPLYYPFSSLFLLSPFTSLIVRLSLDARWNIGGNPDPWIQGPLKLSESTTYILGLALPPDVFCKKKCGNNK